MENSTEIIKAHETNHVSDLHTHLHFIIHISIFDQNLILPGLSLIYMLQNLIIKMTKV